MKSRAKYTPQAPPSVSFLMDEPPPYSIEAEMASLGAAIISDTGLDLLLASLSRGDFYVPAHQTIYDAIARLAAHGTRPDILTLPEELNRKSELGTVGGVAYIGRIENTLPTVSGAEHYIGIVREKSIRRQLISAGNEIAGLARQEEHDTGEVLDLCEQMVLAVGESRQGGEWISAAAGFGEGLKRATGEIPTIPGVKSGFQGLDYLTGGFQGSDLILLAAKPAMGKTALALDIAVNAAAQDEPVDLFSLEMSQKQVFNRMLCARARVDQTIVRRGTVSAAEQQRLRTAEQYLSALPLDICDRSNLTAAEVRHEARRRWKARGTRLIVLDYIQKVRTREKESRNHELGEVARDFKNLAKELDIPLLCISSISRQSDKRADKAPILSDLRDSGELDFEADLVMMLHRPGYFQKEDGTEVDASGGRTDLIIVKHRNGPQGPVKLQFEKKYATFSDEDSHHAGQEPPEYSGGRSWYEDR